MHSTTTTTAPAVLETASSTTSPPHSSTTTRRPLSKTTHGMILFINRHPGLRLPRTLGLNFFQAQALQHNSAVHVVRDVHEVAVLHRESHECSPGVQNDITHLHLFSIVDNLFMTQKYVLDRQLAILDTTILHMTPMRLSRQSKNSKIVNNSLVPNFLINLSLSYNRL